MPEPENVQYTAKVSIAPGPFSALAAFMAPAVFGLVLLAVTYYA